MTNLPPSEFTPRNPEQAETPEQSLHRLTQGVDVLIEGYRRKYSEQNRPMSGYRSNMYPNGGFDEEMSVRTALSFEYRLKRTVNAERQATFSLNTAFGGPRSETQRSWNLISSTIHELTAEGKQIDRPVSPDDIRDLTTAIQVLDPAKTPEPQLRQEQYAPEMSNRERNKAAKELRREFNTSPKLGGKALGVLGIRKSK